MCMCIHSWVWHAHRGLQKPEGTLDSLGFGLQMVVNLPVAARNTGPLQEQPVLLTTEPSFYLKSGRLLYKM